MNIWLKLKKSQSIKRNSYLLAAFSLFSLFLSLYSSQVFLSTASAGLELDMFYAAFKLPDILFAIFASITSPFMILPFLDEKNREEQYGFLFSILKLYLILSTLAASLAFLFAPLYAKLFFGEIYAQSADNFVLFIRLLLLQFILMGAAQIFMAILQKNKQFIDYAIAPILYKLSILILFILLYSKIGIASAIYGAIVGALIYFVYVFIRSKPQIKDFNFSLDKKSIKEAIFILKFTYPRSLSLVVQELFITFYYSFLSFFAAGTISIFQVAYSLQAMFQTIISASYTIASFPDLSQSYVKQNLQAFQKIVSDSLSHMLFWFFPILAAAYLFGFEFIKLIFVHGNFTLSDAKKLYFVFLILLVSFPAQAFAMVLARAFYAAKRAFDVFLAHITVLIFSIIAFAFYFYVKPEISHLIWASLLFVLSQFMLAGILFLKFNSTFVKIQLRNIVNSTVISSFNASLASLIFVKLLVEPSNLTHTILASVVFLLIYVLILYAFDAGLREKIKLLIKN